MTMRRHGGVLVQWASPASCSVFLSDQFDPPKVLCVWSVGQMVVIGALTSAAAFGMAKAKMVLDEVGPGVFGITRNNESINGKAAITSYNSYDSLFFSQFWFLLSRKKRLFSTRQAGLV
ncbi:hypothetical protein Hanom_Chr12g01163891 [Helianthus anomalus]